MKNIEGLLCADDGTLKKVTVKGDARGSHADAIYEFLACRAFDCIGFQDSNIDLWEDDEFIFADSLPNFGLTLTAIALGWPGRHVIKGNGLFLSIDNSTGESISLSDVQKAQIRTAWEWAEARLTEVLLRGLGAPQKGGDQ